MVLGMVFSFCWVSHPLVERQPGESTCISKSKLKGSVLNGTYLSAFAREYGTWVIKDARRSPHAAQRNAGKMLSRGADPRIALCSIRATYRGYHEIWP
jgi:hypothetical protein